MSDLPDIEDIVSYFSPDAKILSKEEGGLFESWRAYLSDSRDLRLSNALREIVFIESLLPEAAKALKREIVDAYLVKCPDSIFGSGIFRVFNIRINDGETSSWVSKPPLLSERSDHTLLKKGPAQLADLYRNKFNGFTSMFGTGGLRPLHLLYPISHHLSDYAETAWYEPLALRTDKQLVFELANNGGGVRALIDLSRETKDVEFPTLIWVDDDDGLEDMAAPLWSFIDSMTEIVLTT